MSAATDDLANRSVRAIVDDAFLPQQREGSSADRTAFTVGGFSDTGLERIEWWLQSMLRQHPLTGPMFEPHRTLLEAVLDDVRHEQRARERNGTS